MPQLSIIVPVFGVEKYIERCARSLFSQTMSDIEFIFVNDCTQDSSMTILKRIIDYYPMRKVIIINHERNLGLPIARKTGLSAATGDYIIHCDSDDWVEPDYCAKLYETAVLKNADIVVCGYSLSDGVSKWQDDQYDDSLLLDPIQRVSAAIALKSSPFVWNKLVKRDVYSNALVYPSHFQAEDWALSAQLICLAKSVAVVYDRLYNYYKNPDPCFRYWSKEKTIKVCHDETNNIRIIEGWLNTYGLGRRYQAELCKRKSVTKSFLFPFAADRKCRCIWRQTFPEINWAVFANKYISREYKDFHFLLLTGLYYPNRKFNSALRRLGWLIDNIKSK